MKIKRMIAAIGLIGLITAVPASAANIKVFVDNSEVSFTDQTPEIVDGRTLVPVRAVFEKAGASVEWDAETSTATLKKDDYTVSIKLGEAYLTKNSVPTAIDVPACMLNDRLSIPVRAIAEAMDFGVSWNTTKNSVLINTSGKTYRPNSQWKTGFLPLEESGFVVNGTLNDISYFDLNRDGENDTIGFVPSNAYSYGGLWINSEDEATVLNKNLKPYGIGIVDFVKNDSYKEIVIFYSSDEGKCVGIYRYNGTDLFQIKANNRTDGLIYFHNQLFMDGCENLISDKDGLCFLNDMICSGVYSLEDGAFSRYSWIPDNVLGKKYTRTFNDNLPFSYIEVENYDKKGKYVDNYVENDIIFSDDLATFTIIDYYVSGSNPSEFEYYIQLPDGTKAVIWPYNV